MTTFQDLGLDFPLFAAPMREASHYSGAQTCTLCRLPQPHCFELGIGDDIVLSCPTCHVTTALGTNGRADGTCSACGTVLPFPTADEKVYSCFDCLRAGRAAFTQDTELGMVRWEDAQRGLTHGVPTDLSPELPGGSIEFTLNEDDWWQAHLPVTVLTELVRTPTYSSWQGERWLFCHQQPMTYLGDWGQDDFHEAAPDGDGQALFCRVVEDMDEHVWDSADDGSIFGIYVFRCRTCAQLRAYYDFT